MKKAVLTLAAVMLAALLVFGISMEARFSGSEFRKESISRERALEEMPEIKITEEDRQLMEFVLGLPDVQSFRETGSEHSLDVYGFPEDKAAALLKEWIRPGSVLQEFSVIGSNVNLSFLCSEIRLDYTFSLEDPTLIHKMIAISEEHRWGTASQTVYLNNNGKIEKLVSRHLWLSWLRE